MQYRAIKLLPLSLCSLITNIMLCLCIYQVYTKKRVQSDKFKTGKQQVYTQNDVIHEETRDVLMGRIPVMVKSDLCWMSAAEKGDCDFDHGGYFLIKGAEKVGLELSDFCLFITKYFYYDSTLVSFHVWLVNKCGNHYLLWRNLF